MIKDYSRPSYINNKPKTNIVTNQPIIAETVMKTRLYKNKSPTRNLRSGFIFKQFQKLVLIPPKTLSLLACNKAQTTTSSSSQNKYQNKYNNNQKVCLTQKCYLFYYLHHTIRAKNLQYYSFSQQSKKYKSIRTRAKTLF